VGLNEAFNLLIKDKYRSMTFVVGIMFFGAVGCYMFNAPLGYFIVLALFAIASVLDWWILRYRVAKGFYCDNEYECREFITKAIELRRRQHKHK